MKKVNLSKYSNSWYNPGGTLKRILWFLVNNLFFKSFFPYPIQLKLFLLKIFGAKIGKNIVLKPEINIKYPWFLEIGHNVWLGEGVWIDNLARVSIGNNVCISQGACLLTGNHDYKKEIFNLIVNPVIIEDGVWIAAKAIICPGVTLKTHSVITAGSVVTKDTEQFTIYQGVPAIDTRKRIIE